MEQMLIARLSGLIVQKMHFHSTRTALNARYEKEVKAVGAPSSAAATPRRSEGDEKDNDNDWEKNVQLSSSLLTLLGTIEGVARLALGMVGKNDKKAEAPSTAALSLAALLVEEALSAFDALSEALLKTANNPEKDQDSTVLRSLLNRYHEAYDSIRAYCAVALQYPYIVALNKVPLLDNELSPLSRGYLPLSRLSSAGSSAGNATTTSPPNVFFATNSSATAAAGTLTTSAKDSTHAPSLAARPFTRRSVLETLEEEEALEDRLGGKVVSNNLESPMKGKSERPKQALSRSSESQEDESEDGEGKTGASDVSYNLWENLGSNSVEHARPPSQFCLETEEEDVDAFRQEDEDEYPQLAETLGSGRPTAVRTRTLGNPFDTGNSSIVLLAEAHRSAFSTISNPFASGHFNAFATNQQLGGNGLGTAKQSTAGANAKDAPAQVQLTQQQRQLATKRALEQCERLFEFSGINLRPSDLVISNEMIGRGAFSIVHKGTLVSTGQEVAVKELLIEEWGRSPETILDFRAEVAVMKAVHHPNVLQLIGASTTPNLRLISEFCHRGNLFDLLYNDRAAQPTASKVLQWSLRIRLVLGEARGMHFLHTAFPAPLIHRDLKSLNLLLSKNWTLKVSDFGLSRFRRRGVNDGPCGTTQWMAPEVILGKEYDERADVYSFGINLWELCSRRVPWEGRQDVKQVVVKGERPSLDAETLDSNCPPELVVLIQRCWAADPAQRPDFCEIVNVLKAIGDRVG